LVRSFGVVTMFMGAFPDRRSLRSAIIGPAAR
jgi:hypothetical protein